MEKDLKLSSNPNNLLEIKLLNQFSPIFTPLIATYSICSSICGYLAPIISVYLSKNLITSTNLPKITDILKDPKSFLPLTSSSIEYIQNSRKAYLETHQKDFKLEEKAYYLKDWVANYEISDYILSLQDETLDNLFFFRFVGWDFPLEASKCTHEEKERLVEEIPFTGKKHIIETFYPKRQLLTLEEWVTIYRKSIYLKEKPVVFVVDIKGHFLSVAFVKDKPRLILFDTTENCYINDPTIEILYKLIEE